MTSKFEFHNAQWIEMVQSQQFPDNEYMYADEPFNPFIHEEDILEHPELYYNPGEDAQSRISLILQDTIMTYLRYHNRMHEKNLSDAVYF